MQNVINSYEKGLSLIDLDEIVVLDTVDTIMWTFLILPFVFDIEEPKKKFCFWFVMQAYETKNSFSPSNSIIFLGLIFEFEWTESILNRE